MGIAFALLAVFGWGVGDFLIQRSTRKIGDWEALFFITLFASIVLFPFVYRTLATLSSFDWIVLVGTSVVILVASLFDFEAIRVGKMSIVEPIYAMEVPITIALTTFLIGEVMTRFQLLLILALLAGIFLVSNKHFGGMRIKTLERGVLLAIVATIGLGVSNFLFGFGSRATDPLIINWFTSVFIAVASLMYLLYKGEAGNLLHNLGRNKSLILAVSVSDNLAWVAYSASTLYLPIGLATGLTESYVALAAILGIFFNREKLRQHQIFGLVLAIVAGVALAFTVA